MEGYADAEYGLGKTSDSQFLRRRGYAVSAATLQRRQVAANGPFGSSASARLIPLKRKAMAIISGPMLLRSLQRVAALLVTSALSARRRAICSFSRPIAVLWNCWLPATRP